MTSIAAVPLLAACEAVAAHAQENPYVEIPMEGRFGEQITARGLEDAFLSLTGDDTDHTTTNEGVSA